MQAKQSGTTVLFHVTPDYNIESILHRGIDPDRSTGKMKVSWYVSAKRIEWAIIHTCEKKLVYPQQLLVCSVLADKSDITKFFLNGYYFTYTRYQVETVTPAMFFIHNMKEG